MAGNDDKDRTIMIPVPGGRSRKGQAAPQAPQPARAPAQAAAAPAYQAAPSSIDYSSAGDINPINAAATTLLTLATHLRQTSSQPDPNALFVQVCNEVQTFDTQLANQAIARESVITARYIICTFFDEMVMGTPWGAQSNWGTQSLLIRFHNEAHGGEKFFDILSHLMKDPANNLFLLELSYTCLVLGFEGKYRLQSMGRSELTVVQDNLFQMIKVNRREYEPALSPHWEAAVGKKTALNDNRIFFVACLACLGIMVAAYTGFLFTINSKSDPVSLKAITLGANIPQLVKKPRTVTATQNAGLAQFLAREIKEGLVSVDESTSAIKITVHGQGLFHSGSATLEENKLGLIQKVASAIESIPGGLLVVGHTDNVPIRSLQFPSNWHLSKERAKTIADKLGGFLQARRIEIEGMADLEPLIANDSAANRAKNRRIEINLFSS